MSSPLRSLVRTLFGRATIESDMDEEINFHIHCRTQELLRRGLPPAEAERQARIEFGARESYKERCREALNLDMVDRLKRDLSFGFRILKRSPAFALILCLTLGFAIGANTAVFELAYSILFRALPYPDADQLVRMTMVDRQTGHIYQNSLADVDDLQAQNKSFQDLGGFVTYTTDVIENGFAASVEICDITPSTLSLLKVRPVAGRWLLPEEDRPGSDSRVAVISYDFWRTHFGGDPKAVVGKPIRTSLTTFTIVGVMPQGFGFPRRTALWITAQNWFALNPSASRTGNRGHRIYEAVGRLRPAVSLRQAEDEMTSMAARLGELYPATNSGYAPHLMKLQAAETAELRPYLLLLIGAGSFVLVLCCASIANLLLAKAAGRGVELAVRAALGASRSAIIRQLLTEGLVASVIGGVFGLALAIVGVRFFAALVPVPLPTWMQIRLHPPVLLFNIAVSVGTGLLAALGPALQSSPEGLTRQLKDAAKGSSYRTHGFCNALVICQIAISTVLLIAAALTVKSFLYLRNASPGYDTAKIITAYTAPYPRGDRQQKITALANYYQKAASQLRKLPGVAAVGVANAIPLDNRLNDRLNGSFFLKGDTEGQHPRLSATIAVASPDYFEALGMKIIEGRNFNELDTTQAPPVVIISQGAAAALWPGQDPLGREIQWRRGTGAEPWLRVIGVVSDIRYDLARSSAYQVYFPYRQQRMDPGHFVIRTLGDPGQLLEAVRKVIASVDPETAVSVQTMQEFADDSIWQQRLSGLVIGIFAALAALLAIVGIYGLLSYSVSQRAREIGIRLALGAQRSEVLSSVLGQGTRLTFTGLTIGLMATFIVTRMMSVLLYGISTTDWTTFVAVPLVLALISMVACCVPAIRATRVDPAMTLRSE
jgi:putative ABC transport system permease protein